VGKIRLFRVCLAINLANESELPTESFPADDDKGADKTAAERKAKKLGFGAHLFYGLIAKG
jgi:hypothetical protein